MSNKKFHFDFMQKRFIAAGVSSVFIVVSLLSVAFQGLNWGLDFTGGMAVELAYENEAPLKEIRTTLDGSQFRGALVQNYGDSKTVLIKLVDIDETKQKTLGEELQDLLREKSEATFSVKRVDIIGPVVGDELRDQSGMAMLVALFIMLAYVALRFSFKFAMGAVIALFHDVIITFGFFSIFQFSFDLSVLAAVLAVIGYSLNDTIVVSDRIRENFKAARMESPNALVNKSLNQTLGRTIITSLTTLFVLLALLVAGGEMLKGFSIALIVGVIVGTYSSIYVASNVLMAMKLSKQDFIEIKPEAVDDMP